MICSDNIQECRIITCFTSNDLDASVAFNITKKSALLEKWINNPMPWEPQAHTFVTSDLMEKLDALNQLS